MGATAIKNPRDIGATLAPMHLSILCNNAIQARRFYCDILGCEERQTTFTSVSLDWFGSQLTIHQLDSYSAKKMLREVEGDDLPAPHFGAVIGENQFLQVASRLKQSRLALRHPSVQTVLGWQFGALDPGRPRSLGQRDRVDEFHESGSGHMGVNRFTVSAYVECQRLHGHSCTEPGHDG
jgi:extradiol dioxygenase family protein